MDDKKRFMTWSRPQFSGALIGLISGLLVIGVSAGLSAIYNFFNQGSYVQFGDSEWYYLVFPILFGVMSVGLLLLAGVVLPLMRTWSRGKKTIVTAFIAEMFVFLLSLIVLLLIAAHTHQPNDGTSQACDLKTLCCDISACALQ